MSSSRDLLVAMFESTPANEPGVLDGVLPGDLYRKWSEFMADRVLETLNGTETGNLEQVRREIESRIRTAIAYGAGAGYRDRPSQERADWIQREVAAAMLTLDSSAKGPVSALPRDQMRDVPMEAFVQDLARALDRARGTAVPIATTVEQYLAEHSTLLPTGVTGAWVGEGIGQIITDDTVYDTERNKASRAAQFILGSLLGDTARARGWFAGEEVFVGGVSYALTGNACPKCEINPEVFGSGWKRSCTGTSCDYSEEPWVR